MYSVTAVLWALLSSLHLLPRLSRYIIYYLFIDLRVYL